MRLVRFEDESGGFAVDLHPLITVISGLPPHVRERLVNGIASLPRGTDPGGRGTIEVHGVFLDLNRESLELLELDQDLDVVLRPADLPGAEPVAPSGSSAGDDGPGEDEVRDARRLADARDREYEEALAAVEMYRSQLASVEEEQAALHRLLAEARGGLDPFAEAGLQQARADHEEAVAAVTATGGAVGSASRAVAGDAAADDEPLNGVAFEAVSAVESVASTPEAGAETIRAERQRIEERLSYLIDESDRLKRVLKSLRAIDPAPVQAAFVALGPAPTPSKRAVRPQPADETPAAAMVPELPVAPAEPVSSSATEVVELRPSPEAAALADEWEDWSARWSEANSVVDPSRERLDALTSARDSAYDAMKAAERELRSPELDPAIVDRLESVHDEIFELDGKSPRFGAGKLRRRVESLRAEQTSLLGQLGFDSWSSYIMGITAAGSDPSRRHAHEAAAKAYEAAESELERAARETVDAPPAIDPAVIDDLERSRDDLRRRIVDVLGADPGDDPVVALRAFRVEVRTLVEAPAPIEPSAAADTAPSDTAPSDTAPSDTAPSETAAGDTDLDEFEEAEPPRPVDPEAAQALYDALAATGATLPDRDLTVRELRALASGWLETMNELPGRIADATATRDGIEAEIAALAAELEGLPDHGGLLGHGGASDRTSADDVTSSEQAAPTSAVSTIEAPAPAPVSALADDSAAALARVLLGEAESRLVEAEQRWNTHQMSSTVIVDLEARQARLAAQAQAAHEALADREPTLASLLEARVAGRNQLRRVESQRSAAETTRWDLRHQPEMSPTRLLGGSATAEAVEWYVLARLAQQRSVSFVGSVPLAIDDAFANWPVEALGDVFTRLERMGEVIQIVYLTDDPEVGQWARNLGTSRALVLDMRIGQ